MTAAAAYGGRRHFTSPRWMKIAVCLAEVPAVAGAWYYVAYAGATSWMALGFLALVLLGIGGILETFVQRVVLDDDSVHVVTLWSRRGYPRSAVKRIWSAKGVDMVLELTNGARVRLPPVGPYLPNSMRAWQKAGA